MTNNEQGDLILKKADAFWVLGTKVHISLTNGNWKRGIIKEVKHELLILDESLEGQIPLFFVEIKSIEAFTPKKEEIT